MPRCSICDKQSEGLSDYNPMEHFHASVFYNTPDGPVCDECYSDINDTLADFVDEEEEE